jgi:hypothetical protein
MSFEFIDNSNIDRRSRKVIRRHVAKGKNAGKVISRPKHSEARSKAATKQASVDALIEQAAVVARELAFRPPLERQFSDSLAVMTFPAEVSARSRGMVQNCTSSWIQLGQGNSNLLTIDQSLLL